MANNIFERYLEAEVLGASPVKLTYLLYRGAGDAVSSARRSLASGDVGERSRQIMRAWEIVNELSRSLDHTSCSDLTGRLADLYGYLQQRLLDANVEQSDAPLAETEELLATLASAWREIIPSHNPEPAAAHTQAEYVPVSCSA